VGATDPAWKLFFWSCPPPFWLKSTISHFGERFRDGQYSLVSFLFAVLLLTVPPRAQSFVNVWGTYGVGATDPNPTLRQRARHPAKYKCVSYLFRDIHTVRDNVAAPFSQQCVVFFLSS